jgi:hypothetical protein
MTLHFTSGYHPEGDGQTERVNQTLEQYLRVYCNYQQDNWSELLPLAEFAYNNAPSATTGLSPFYVNKGYHPNLTVHPERDLASSRARDFGLDIDHIQTTLKEQIKSAQSQYQDWADARRALAPEFAIGSYVFVKAQFFWTTRPSKKLAEKYLGPFEVIAEWASGLTHYDMGSNLEVESWLASSIGRGLVRLLSLGDGSAEFLVQLPEVDDEVARSGRS